MSVTLLKQFNKRVCFYPHALLPDCLFQLLSGQEHFYRTWILINGTTGPWLHFCISQMHLYNLELDRILEYILQLHVSSQTDLYKYCQYWPFDIRTLIKMLLNALERDFPNLCFYSGWCRLFKQFLSVWQWWWYPCS